MKWIFNIYIYIYSIYYIPLETFGDDDGMRQLRGRGGDKYLYGKKVNGVAVRENKTTVLVYYISLSELNQSITIVWIHPGPFSILQFSSFEFIYLPYVPLL